MKDTIIEVMEQIKRSIRGFALISITLLFVTFLISQILFPAFSIYPSAENEIIIPIGQIAIALIISLFLLIASSTPTTVIFTGLVFGGSVSNFIESQFFNPVKDYIYVISTGDLYCNVADLAIVAGILMFIIMGICNWIRSGSPLIITLIKPNPTGKTGTVS